MNQKQFIKGNIESYLPAFCKFAKARRDFRCTQGAGITPLCVGFQRRSLLDLMIHKWKQSSKAEWNRFLGSVSCLVSTKSLNRISKSKSSCFQTKVVLTRRTSLGFLFSWNYQQAALFQSRNVSCLPTKAISSWNKNEFCFFVQLLVLFSEKMFTSLLPKL